MGTLPISWQKGTDLKRYVPFLSAWVDSMHGAVLLFSF